MICQLGWVHSCQGTVKTFVAKVYEMDILKQQNFKNIFHYVLSSDLSYTQVVLVANENEIQV